MPRHRYGSPTAFAVSCLGKEKNKFVKIFGLSVSMSIKGSQGLRGAKEMTCLLPMVLLLANCVENMRLDYSYSYFFHRNGKQNNFL